MECTHEEIVRLGDEHRCASCDEPFLSISVVDKLITENVDAAVSFAVGVANETASALITAITGTRVEAIQEIQGLHGVTPPSPFGDQVKSDLMEKIGKTAQVPFVPQVSAQAVETPFVPPQVVEEKIEPVTQCEPGKHNFQRGTSCLICGTSLFLGTGL